MSEQRKISSRKVIRFSVGAVVVILFMVALAAASNRQNNDTVKGIEVTLNEDNAISFLDKKDIVNLLVKSRHIDLNNTRIDQLDLKKMEEAARTNPWVEKAEVFIDNREVLKVNITQRTPVARLFDVNGGSYYMDSSLHVMPVSAGYAYPAPVFTNVPVLKDSAQQVLNAKMVYLSSRIERDSFWNAQITQVEVQPDQTFVMVPLLGDQKILIGDTAAIDEKLGNLMAFYKHISSKIGWDKYKVLDVRFKGQVVASPSVGWTPPKVTDTAADDLEGPPVAAVAVPVKPAVQNESSHTVPVKPAAARPAAPKPEPAARPKVTTPKPVTQAKKPSAKDDKDKTKQKENNAKTPKYIYPGKKTGNH